LFKTTTTTTTTKKPHPTMWVGYAEKQGQECNSAVECLPSMFATLGSITGLITPPKLIYTELPQHERK
jgi:hypothetical protein